MTWLGALVAVVAGASLFVTAGSASASVGQYLDISNIYYRTCATAVNGNLNAAVGQYVCINSDLQLWFPANYPPRQPGQPAYLHLINRYTGYCLEVNNNSTAAGARVDAFYCGSSGVDWMWTPRVRTVAGIYGWLEHLVNGQPTGECLDTVGGANSVLMQYTCDRTLHGGHPETDPQLWKLS